MSKAIDFLPERNLIEVRADGTIIGNYWENLTCFEMENAHQWAAYRETLIREQITRTIQELSRTQKEQQKGENKTPKGGNGAPGYSEEEKRHLVFACLTFQRWLDRIAYMQKHGFERTRAGLIHCLEDMKQTGEWDYLIADVLFGLLDGKNKKEASGCK